MTLHLINPEQMLRRGLRSVGLDDQDQQRLSKETKVRKFKALFGKHPLHCCRAWRDLQTTTIPGGCIDPYDTNAFVGFLAANNFLKCYASSDDVRATLFKMNEKTIRDLTWYYVDKLAKLRNIKIKFPEDHEWETIYIASTDGTHARANEPRDPNVRKNPKWYSHKDETAGLNYEVALHLWKQQVIHAKTWDPASVHDLTAFRMELLNKIPQGKLVIADRGYISKDLSHVLATPSPLDSAEVKQFKKEARARHENFNKRLKDYSVLSGKFRHGVHKHQMCFDAVLVMCQYAIEDTGLEGEPLNSL